MSFEDRLREYRDTLDGAFVVGVEANRFVEMMERDHPGELAEWMRCHAIAFAATAFGDMERRERAKAIRRAGAREFQRVAEANDVEGLSLFRTTFVVNDEHLRLPLRDMRGADCSFAAGEFAARGNQQLAMAAFLRALGKKAGRRTVGEVMDETTCERLLRSFLPGSELPVPMAA
ncbi:MAG TPA: hypothetical protein VFT41_03260 [Gemmatimonadaceae bacterium]|nr:hypothetical protein [Gemmatimonadaceae bacterium]